MDHAKFLTRCLQLASYGRGRTHLNPSVGAVIVLDGKIIGEGYHHEYGGPHAEVLAIRSVKNPEDLKAATLYCTLEPCAHYGKTPPCCELITAHGIPHVVIGFRDPHEKVDGKGIAHMKAHGVKVEFAPEPELFVKAHQSFWINYSQKRPMITLKWAESLDGFIDRERSPKSLPSSISGPLASIASHRLRAQVDGILISSKTVHFDRPSLNTRFWSGTSPRPIILYSKAYPIAPESIARWSESPIVIAREEVPGLDTIIADPQDISTYLTALLYRGIGHVLVEGGAAVLRSFLDQGYADSIWFYKSNTVELGDGVQAPSVDLNDHSIAEVLDTERDIWYVRR